MMTKDQMTIENLNLRALVKRLHKEIDYFEYRILSESDGEDLRQSSIELEKKLGISRDEFPTSS